MSKSKELVSLNKNSNSESKQQEILKKSESPFITRCGQDLGRTATYTRNVYRDKTPPPIIKQIYERAPTPPKDMIEKVYIKREPQIIYEMVYQKPREKSPIVIEKFEVEPAPQPIHRCRVVELDDDHHEQSKKNTTSTVKIEEITDDVVEPPKRKSSTPYQRSKTVDLDYVWKYKPNEYAPIPQIEARPFNLEVEELIKKYVGSGGLANTPLSKAETLANKNRLRIKMKQMEDNMIKDMNSKYESDQRDFRERSSSYTKYVQPKVAKPSYSNLIAELDPQTTAKPKITQKEETPKKEHTSNYKPEPVLVEKKSHEEKKVIPKLVSETVMKPDLKIHESKPTVVPKPAPPPPPSPAPLTPQTQIPKKEEPIVKEKPLLEEKKKQEVENVEEPKKVQEPKKVEKKIEDPKKSEIKKVEELSKKQELNKIEGPKKVEESQKKIEAVPKKVLEKKQLEKQQTSKSEPADSSKSIGSGNGNSNGNGSGSSSSSSSSTSEPTAPNIICTTCTSPIPPGEKIVQFETGNYHENCFKCSGKCGQPLNGKKFLRDPTNNGKFLCEQCKPTINCSKCNKKFSNGEPFYKGDTDDIKYCVDCFNKSRNGNGNGNGDQNNISTSSSSSSKNNNSSFSSSTVSCSFCSKEIKDSQILSFEGSNYHMDCFKCSKCKKSLNGQPFFLDKQFGLTCDQCRPSESCSMCRKKFGNGEPFYKGESEDIKYCVECFNKKTSSLSANPTKECSVCMGKIVAGETSLIFDNKTFHSKCFRCSSCMEQINASIKFYKDNKGSIICSNCSF